ncbi:DGQHR domain-containing protein [Arundinibacter roseus]|uniref:DGQHR domain-containing protein n=1 Tax=Arundinibacter roseus TaxID=2070510 RepID=A0A4R4JZP9_9BACT|nr:DNA sulfur modification protein DndB [Arundinibacter roseus]TDB60404.1 DGQHR domain-containing protein [Arundinibacter roseus]
MDNRILLPAIKGIIGDWVYYQTVMPFYEVVNRIDNDHSIREYKSLDDYLQRELSKRSKKIASYLIREETRFFNSAVIGIFGGNPNWYNFAFGPTAVPELEIDDFVLNTLGVLELGGDEKLFSIDGQHRVEGIKQALNDNFEKFQNDELPMIIVAHRDTKEGKIRTRRLFSEINTKAVRVSGLDELITNEDNPSDINARKIYAEFDYFEKDNFIQLNGTKQIGAEDSEFTTILCLKSVNQILYKSEYNFNNVRPSEKILNSLYDKTFEFWSQAIEEVPVYRQIFIDKSKKISDFRSREGGSMLLRPVGIEIMAEAYVNWIAEKGSKKEFWNNFNKIQDNLDSIHWNHILWDSAAQTMAKSISLKFTREYTKYLLDLDHDHEYIIENYTKMKGEGESTLIPLPERP